MEKKLFFVGNKNMDEVLLQDGKGRFYVLRVKHGRLVVNRDRFPILNDYHIPGEGVIQLPFLEIHQEQGGGKLSLFSTDPQRFGDVCKVGTLNPAFAYEPDWEGLCVTIDGFFVDDMYKVIPAKTLPGWEWVVYEDGSGFIRSIHNDSFFHYDMNPGLSWMMEYRADTSSSWEFFEGYEWKESSLLEQFMAFAEEELKKMLNY